MDKIDKGTWQAKKSASNQNINQTNKDTKNYIWLNFIKHNVSTHPPPIKWKSYIARI